jgi:hypothetical protein
MKDKTIEETDKLANDIIGIYKGLGWIITALDPALFQYFWAEASEGHFISKLRAHLSSLDKDVKNHFPITEKELLIKALEDFINVNSNYRDVNKPESNWYLELERRLIKKWYLRQLRKKGEEAFARTVILLAKCKKN